MSRTFSDNIAGNNSVISLLDKLIDKNTESDAYANALYELGVIFGNQISARVEDSTHTISLASTVEDADSLGKGIIDALEKNGKKVLLTVFWNKRLTENDIPVAPIIKEFHESGYQDAHILVIIKSIISSSCVVRTNLTKLINESDPKRIFVVAPVLLKGATTSLESEFDSWISNKFEYLYFAEDDQKTKDGIVIPGIGGNLYQRLGYSDQAAKNGYVPLIVKQRRARSLH